MIPLHSFPKLTLVFPPRSPPFLSAIYPTVDGTRDYKATTLVQYPNHQRTEHTPNQDICTKRQLKHHKFRCLDASTKQNKTPINMNSQANMPPPETSNPITVGSGQGLQTINYDYVQGF